MVPVPSLANVNLRGSVLPSIYNDTLVSRMSVMLNMTLTLKRCVKILRTKIYKNNLTVGCHSMRLTQLFLTKGVEFSAPSSSPHLPLLGSLRDSPVAEQLCDRHTDPLGTSWAVALRRQL